MDDVCYIMEEWMYEWDYFEPKEYFMKGDGFKRKCLDCWAANEVIEQLKSRPREDPLDIINNLRDMADNFCCCAKTTQAKDIFTALYDVSTTALDFLLNFME